MAKQCADDQKPIAKAVGEKSSGISQIGPDRGVV